LKLHPAWFVLWKFLYVSAIYHRKYENVLVTDLLYNFHIGRDRFHSDNIYYSMVKVYSWDRLRMKDGMNFCHWRRYWSSKVTRSYHIVDDENLSRADKLRVFVFFYLAWHEYIHRQTGIFVCHAAIFVHSAMSSSWIQTSLFVTVFTTVTSQLLIITDNNEKLMTLFF